MKKRARVRAKIFGTPERPRLSVFKSNRYIYVQLIDDVEGKTLASSSSLNLDKKRGKMSEQAIEIGKKIAEEAKKQNIKQVVFDRGVFPYAGNVERLATGAREGGLVF